MTQITSNKHNFPIIIRYAFMAPVFVPIGQVGFYLLVAMLYT